MLTIEYVLISLLKSSFLTILSIYSTMVTICLLWNLLQSQHHYKKVNSGENGICNLGLGYLLGQCWPHPKADWGTVDSPKKMNKQICFVCFFAFHDKQNKFFWENLWRAQTAFGFIWPLSILAIGKANDSILPLTCFYCSTK